MIVNPDPVLPTTTDRLLGGRVILNQHERGHRAGHDAALLAAATPARAGERVLDLGAGTGAAGLCLAARVPIGYLTMVEVDPLLAALAEANAIANGLRDRTRVIVADVRARGAMRERSGLLLGAIDRVLMNPPFHDASRGRASPHPGRRLAHSGSADLLSAFLRTATAVLKPGGTVTLIHRADEIETVLATMRGRFGGLLVRPVHGKAGGAAVRLLITGTKGSRAPLAILPGIVLTDADGQPTPEAERLLRDAAALA